MRRREFISLLSGALANWPLVAHTQQATKLPQIGILSLGRGDKSDASLRLSTLSRRRYASLVIPKDRILHLTGSSQMAM
jgi:hypothetical protein